MANNRRISILSLIIFGLLIFVAYFLVSVPYYSGDVKNHLVWAKSIVYEGTYGFYEREFRDFAFPNYPPVAMILFSVSYLIYQIILGSVHFLNNTVSFFPSNLVHFFEWENVEIAFLKLPELLATFGISVCLYLISKNFFDEKKRALSIALIFLLNPAVIYLSAIWGQIDLLPIFFLLLSLIFVNRKNILLSAVFAALAILSKQTVILFWLIMLVYLVKTSGIKNMLIFVLINVVIFYISYLPFHSFSLTWPVGLYQTNFSLVAFSTDVNTINFWGIISNFVGQSDIETLFGLTLNQIGYLLFLVVFAPVFLVFLRRKPAIKDLFFVFYLAILISFFVLTRMHERYLIPAIVFGSFFIFKGIKYLVSYVFFSALHFLNLYRGLYQPDVSTLVMLVKSTTFLDFLVLFYGIFIAYNIFLYLKRKV